ncbi:UNVERIFIED_ORG: bacterial extracellular solute-binding domain protein, partial [Clostridioides difficile Y384]
MKMNEKIRNMTIGLFCAATVSILLTGCVSGEATKQSAAADDSLDT